VILRNGQKFHFCQLAEASCGTKCRRYCVHTA
jgi:hypothetical protein